MDLCFAFHFMNGFDVDGVISIDACEYTHAPLFPTADGEASADAKPYLSRWTIDMNAAQPHAVSNRIDENQSEFPQCDPRYAGKPYRHGWYTSSGGEVKSESAQNEGLFNVVGHFDHATGKVDSFSCGPCHVSESIFVPASENAAEGEGHLLSVVTSYETHTSSLFVFNALDVAAGPVARVHLSHRIPVGFHGGWRAAG